MCMSKSRKKLVGSVPLKLGKVVKLNLHAARLTLTAQRREGPSSYRILISAYLVGHFTKGLFTFEMVHLLTNSVNGS